MRKACIAVLILTAVLLCGCKGTEEKKEEVLLGMECNYEGTTFTIDKVELRNSKFFRVYLITNLYCIAKIIYKCP